MIETLLGIDQKIFLLINSWNAEWLNPLMVFASGRLIWIPFAAFIVISAFKELDKKSFLLFAFFLLLTIGASDATSSSILKSIFERFRPCKVAELKPLINLFGQRCGGRFGFVSSHAANSFAIMGFYVLALKKKPSMIYLLFLLPITVSWSRVYLGVHYPGDILGGVIVGVSWASLMAYFFRRRNLGS